MYSRRGKYILFTWTVQMCVPEWIYEPVLENDVYTRKMNKEKFEKSTENSV